MADADQMIIDSRFNGPPGSGNGGYTAGLVATALAAATGPDAVVVTLRMPPPLDTPLRVARTAAGVEVYAGDQLVAEAAPTLLADEPVPPVSFEEALAASAGYAGFTDHPFPTCYVCGPERAPGDGLRIFPGPLPDGRTAAPWLVPARVSAVTVWSALDCPGGWAIIGTGRPYVLGRIAVRVDAVPEAGARCVVMGAVAGTEGRKAHVRSTLYAADRTVLARARATWLAAPKPAPEPAPERPPLPPADGEVPPPPGRVR